MREMRINWRTLIISLFAIVYPLAARDAVSFFELGRPWSEGLPLWAILLTPPLITFWWLPIQKTLKPSHVSGVSILYIVIFYVGFTTLPALRNGESIFLLSEPAVSKPSPPTESKGLGPGPNASSATK